ncbi:MAG: DUF5678 domain-containing protein [Nitrosopumilaceae archaeon]
MSSAESQYLLSLENKEQYRGKWIAIIDSKIIAEGKELSEVYKKALEIAKGRTPLFEHIPEKEEEETLIL